MKDENLCEQRVVPKGATVQPKHWAGFEFLEMVLPFSTLLAPGSVEVTPEVKSPSSNQCKDLHLLEQTSTCLVAL